MSVSSYSPVSPLKVFLGAVGVFIFFGFLALILSGYAGHESVEDRAYMGEFDAETIQQRWDNLEEIEAAQGELFNEERVDAALAKMVGNVPAAAKSEFVVPGSPTFMKQMNAASEPEEEPAEKKEESGEGDSGSDSGKPEEEAKAPAAEPTEAKETPSGDDAKKAEKPKSEAPAAPEKAKADDAKPAGESAPPENP
ncbi:MAG: hypothetical protein AAGF67_01990 [Verrucomicrobiota bacterium]